MAWVRQLQDEVVADIAGGAPAELDTTDVARALLILIGAVLGGEPRFDRSQTAAVMLAPTRLREMWADPAKRRLVSRGAMAAIHAGVYLRELHALSAEERLVLEALLEGAERTGEATP